MSPGSAGSWRPLRQAGWAAKGQANPRDNVQPSGPAGRKGTRGTDFVEVIGAKPTHSPERGTGWDCSHLTMSWRGLSLPFTSPRTARPEHTNTHSHHPQTYIHPLCPSRSGGAGTGRYAVPRPGVPAGPGNPAPPPWLRTAGRRSRKALPAAARMDARGRHTWGASGHRRAVATPGVPGHNFAQRAPPSRLPPILTQILSQVEQEARGSSAELVEEGPQAEDQQGGHAETVVPEGEAQER
jgi:hypothetical protein